MTGDPTPDFVRCLLQVVDVVHSGLDLVGRERRDVVSAEHRAQLGVDAGDIVTFELRQPWIDRDSDCVDVKFILSHCF